MCVCVCLREGEGGVERITWLLRQFIEMDFFIIF